MRLLSIIFISSLFVACSQQQNDTLISLQEKSEGIIVKASQEDREKIEAKYDVTAEVISREAGVYLFKGISQQDVKMLDLKTETFRNTFVDLPRVAPLPKEIQALQPKNDPTQPMGAPEAKPEEPATPTLGCAPTTKDLPLAVVEVKNGSDRIFTAGDSVEANSAKSLSSATLSLLRSTNPIVMSTERQLRETAAQITCAENDPRMLTRQCLPQAMVERVVSANLEQAIRQAIRTNLITLAPSSFETTWLLEDAVGEVQILNTSTITFSPNRVGQYTLHLVVKDKLSSACSLESTPIYVTANPKVSDLPLQIRRLKPGAESNFFHLAKTENIAARQKSTGKDVVVAVIDSGVNYNHPSIRPNLYVNTAEIPDNGIDDDGNGLVDDVSGYDFALDDAYPFDENRHGTHVAGIIAATDVGIAPNAKILPIKIGPAPVSAILKGMQYAVDQKAAVINMSLRAYATTEEEVFMYLLANPYEAIIKSGIASNSLFVLGAGNETLNNDQLPIMPANSKMPNAITVAAIDENDKLTEYSNFGAKEVDIATYGGTPKNPIFSTFIYDDLRPYVGLSGTSMSTPLIAGIAAQIKEILPSSTAAEVIKILKESSVPNENLKDKISFGAHAHSLRAVDLALQRKANVSPLR